MIWNGARSLVVRLRRSLRFESKRQVQERETSAIVCCDEKLGVRADRNEGAGLAPESFRHDCVMRR
jgi:hypothetical protein